MWYVYFLELSNKDIYVGSTDDLKRRFNQHQAGYVASTKSYLPVSLLRYVAVRDETHARQLENYFKSGSGKALALKRFVRRGWPTCRQTAHALTVPDRINLNTVPLSASSANAARGLRARWKASVTWSNEP